MQHELVEAERKYLGRDGLAITSKAGYAGGLAGSPNGWQLRGDGWVEHILAAEWKRYAVRKFDSLTRGTPTNNSSLICC